jgi:phasin family protein
LAGLANVLKTLTSKSLKTLTSKRTGMSKTKMVDTTALTQPGAEAGPETDTTASTAAAVAAAPRAFETAVGGVKERTTAAARAAEDHMTAAARAAEDDMTVAAGAAEQTRDKAQQTMERAMKTAEEMMQFGQGNVEAWVKSGQIMVAGLQDLGKQIAATAQATFDESMSTFKAMTSARSVKEAMDMQTSLTRAAMEKAMAETGRLTEASFKLAEQSAAPLAARFSLAVEKFGRTA